MRQWTDHERVEIAAMLKRQLTAGQIARKFAGRSRSAIIGLVNRHPVLRAVGFHYAKRAKMGRSLRSL